VEKSGEGDVRGHSPRDGSGGPRPPACPELPSPGNVPDDHRNGELVVAGRSKGGRRVQRRSGDIRLPDLVT
jgi:hypothetical protein